MILLAMTGNYKVGAVGVYDKSRVPATADKWFVIANVILNGNGQRYVKYDTDVRTTREPPHAASPQNEAPC